MSEWVNGHALWQILIAGLVCGAGLPTVFALGLRALAMPVDAEPTAATRGDRVVVADPLRLAVAVICFASVVAGIGWGIYVIVSSG